MRERFTEAWSFIREVLHEFSEDDCFAMSAALAYYAVFSLAPLLVTVLWIATMFISADQADAAMTGELQGLLGPEGAEEVHEMVTRARSGVQGQGFARALGISVALFGGTGVMVQLQLALNRAWDVRPDPARGGIKNFLFKRLLSFGLILTIAFLLLTSLALTAVVSAVALHAAMLLPANLTYQTLHVLNFAVSFFIVTALFAVIFRFMPEAIIRWRDVMVGAAFTAMLFTIGKTAIGVYLGNSDVGSTFGAASSLVVVLLWIHYSALILMLGAEFTQVWTRRYGAGLHPAKGAVSTHRKRKFQDRRGEDQPA